MNTSPSPRTEGRLAAADLLRVLCIGTVAWFHIWQQSWLSPNFVLFGHWVNGQAFVSRGSMAVDLTMVLSGFLLYRPCADRAAEGREPLPDTLSFYKKRLKRILPAYLLAVFLALVNTLVCGRSAGSAPLWVDLGTHLTFTFLFSRTTYHWTSLNVALWTVAVEMQFYALFPFLARAFAKRPWLTWGAMTAAALLCRGLVWQMADPNLVFNQLPCMLDLFACGMLSAHLLRKTGTGRSFWAVPACLLLLAGMVWMISHGIEWEGYSLQQNQLFWRLPLGLAGGAFLFLGGLWPVRCGAGPGGKLLAWLSKLSYHFYIWHQYLACKLKVWNLPAFVTEMPQRDEGVLWQRKYTALCWAVGFAAAILSCFLTEQLPALLKKKKEE